MGEREEVRERVRYIDVWRERESKGDRQTEKMRSMN
jgi:hypothetical protein